MEFNVQKRIATRITIQILASFMLAVFCSYSLPVIAEEIYIVSSRATGPHARVSSAIKQHLGSHLPVRFNVHLLSSAERKSIPLNAGKGDFIITIGTDAYADVLANKSPAKILATLLPQQTFTTLREKYNRSLDVTSAVYLEQSVQRNLDLVRIALPKKTAGVLIGSRSTRLYSELTAAQREQSLRIYLRRMKPKENLIEALNQVLEKSNVLIAFSDPEVSNRNTAQHLLLTTYRHGIPVVAYSRAYVKAGALMAVYSTPEQYALHTAEMVLKNIRSKKSSLPAPEFPKYFSVEINQRVARSLGIKLKPKHIIESQLNAIGVGAE